jgi:hypothetical protein
MKGFRPAWNVGLDIPTRGSRNGASPGAAVEVLAYGKMARPWQGIEQQGVKPALADDDLADALTAGKGWPVVAS